MAAQKKYRVGKSKIEGNGAFAKKDLKLGEIIGKAHTINQLYTDYDFTELGKNHNHSENPNVQNVLIGNDRLLVATKNIKKGQELTSDYRLQPDLEQPEDFKKAKSGGLSKRNGVPKAQVGGSLGKTEDEVRAAILKKAEEVFKSGKKPYKVPDEITQGSYLTGRKVCIQGVCGILSDAGFIPNDYYTNTKFAEKANEFGFGNPLTDVNRLKPGDVFQHFTEKNEQGNYYPTHGEIFKGWNDKGEAEFYDYYDYYNYPLGMSEGIRSYSKDELVERLNRRANKDNSGKQAQFFSLAGNFPTKKSFPYNLPENELQEYFDETHASNVTYGAPESNIPNTSPLYYMSGEDVRQDVKDTLVGSFNDKQLDSQLRKNLKVTDQELQKIKPLVYGMIGQETQFGNPRSGLGNLKYAIENLIQPEGTSLGPGQIKLSSISKDTRKKFNINKNKDLLDPKNTYIAMVDILTKAANVTDKHVTPETHPELVDKDRFERALYFVNSPGKIRKTDKQLSEQVLENAPWWSNFSERKMEQNIRRSKNAPLRMDATSYPGKVKTKADTLERSIDLEDTGVLPEIMITAPKKQKNGGWLDKYEDGGEYLGTTNKGFNYNGAWGGPSMAMGGSMPGAVGFTYARTGSIPSNGPYAKKTKASAQDGRAVSYETRIKPVITDKPMNRETVRSIESTEPKDERSLLETLSNFIPYYETYVDLKDVAIGGLTGDKARMNQGIIGLGAPFAGKVVTGGMDYLTEKALGKDVADYNEIKRSSVVNMSQNDRQKLFEKYGPGGYDKWIKAGKPKLQNGGEMKFYQEGLDWTPKNISMNGSKLKKAQLGTHMLNPFSSTLGNNMMEMLSAPQKALTALFSGKYQDPSEAMGIQNPYGAFAIDAILDPTNLVGAGLAKKMLTGTKAAQKVSRMDHLKELVKMKQEGVDLSKFFEDLNWTQKGKDLWKEASKYNVNILTGGRELAPGQDAISTGKRLWSKKNLNLEGDNIIVEKQKAKYANPNVILVDDLKDNVNKFRDAGGHAILHTDTKKTIKELNKHMAKNPNHKVYMDLDGVLVDLEGGVHKFRGKKKNGDMINKAQNGIRQRAASDNTRVATPLIKELLTMDEAKKQEEANRFWNAVANQPVIQSPKGKQLTREQILQKNKEYAQAQGKRFDPNSGAVTPFLSPSAGKALDRANESVLNTANAALMLTPHLVQSTYKPGYTAKDALLGKPSGSSFVEDMITDPTMWASFGLKGLLKGALTKGAIGKGLLSSAALPFYKSLDVDPGIISQFQSKLDQVKDLVTSKDAREAFANVANTVTRSDRVNRLDEDYVKAITNPNLPEKALDKFAQSIISINPEENALSAEQIKYLGKITGLTTDVARIANASSEDKLKFLIDNSQGIAPRDLLPAFYGDLTANMSSAQRKQLVDRLYDSYGGVNTPNPLAVRSAAADIFTLADDYAQQSPLSNDIAMGIEDLESFAKQARPKVYIDDPYFDPRFKNANSEDVIYSLFRDFYRGIPNSTQRGEQARRALSTARTAMTDVLTNPVNKGRFFTGSKSLSTDSQPLSLAMIAGKKDVVDIVPVHGGGKFDVLLDANLYGGLTDYNRGRSNYLGKLKSNIEREAGNYSQGVPYGHADRLQKQMLEAAYYDYHTNKFNKAVGTNLPSAMYVPANYYGEHGILRPNVGIVVKKDGGPVKKKSVGWLDKYK